MAHINPKLHGFAVLVESLSCDPKNARKHDDHGLDAIAASLKEFGQQKLIVADAGGIVRAGNGAYLAAKRLGWKWVAVVESNLQGAKLSGYGVADNRTGDLSTFDDDLLVEILKSTQEDGVSLDAMGFTEAEFAKLLPDEADDEPVLKQLETLPPPKMTWVLVGIPTVQFGSISSLVEQLASTDGTILETTSNNG